MNPVFTMTRQVHNKWPRKTLDRKTERSNPFHLSLSGRGPSPGCRNLRLLPTLEAHTTATSKTKSLNSQSTLATMMRRCQDLCQVPVNSSEVWIGEWCGVQYEAWHSKVQAQLMCWLTGHWGLRKVGWCYRSQVGVTLEMDRDYASSTESSFRMIMEKRPENDILVDFQTGVTSQCWSDVYIQIRY